MSVFIEVWHRIHPLTELAYQRFAAYYGEWVVNANPELLDVIGGWRYLDGETNCDVALYRYPSLSAIEQTMASFGADPDYLRATDQLFRDIDLEELRSICFSLPFSPDTRIEQASQGNQTHTYLRVARRLPTLDRPEAYDAMARLIEAREKAGPERLLLAAENMIGNVMQCTEWWQLPEGAGDLTDAPHEIDTELLRTVERLAPETTRHRLAPLAYSRLR